MYVFLFEDIVLLLFEDVFIVCDAISFLYIIIGCLPEVFAGKSEFIFLKLFIIFRLDFFLSEKIFFADELRWE